MDLPEGGGEPRIGQAAEKTGARILRTVRSQRLDEQNLHEPSENVLASGSMRDRLVPDELDEDRQPIDAAQMNECRQERGEERSVG